MPSDTTRHLERPGIASGAAKVNVMLAKGPSPAPHISWATLRSLDLTLKNLKQEHKVL